MLKQNQVKVISTDHAIGLLVHWPHGGADSDVTLATVIGMGSIPTPPRCCVHVDIVGPLPDFSGHKYLLTVVDRFTRWPEAIPMKDITEQSCAGSFLLHWVARFGSPIIITTDRGAQFTSLLWTEMCQFLGSKLCHTTALF